MTHVLHFFYPTASATAYGQRPKFFRAEHSATAEGENCAYSPTLQNKETNVKSDNWKEAKKFGMHFASSQWWTRFTFRNSCPA